MNIPPGGTAPRNKPLYTSPGFLVAAIFLVTILVVAMVLVVVDPFSGSPAPSSAPVSPVVVVSPHASPSGTGCPVVAGNQAEPLTAPTVTWSLFQGVAVPASATEGPLIVHGDIARCYGHDPTGALLAAAQISMRVEVAPDWQSVVQALIEPGAGQAAFLQQRAQLGTLPTTGLGQIAGFQYVTYTPQVAVVDLALSLGTARTTVSYTVVWDGGDWRLQAQPDGGLTPQPQPLQSLDGYVPWAGV